MFLSERARISSLKIALGRSRNPAASRDISASHPRRSEGRHGWRSRKAPVARPRPERASLFRHSSMFVRRRFERRPPGSPDRICFVSIGAGSPRPCLETCRLCYRPSGESAERPTRDRGLGQEPGKSRQEMFAGSHELPGNDDDDEEQQQAKQEQSPPDVYCFIGRPGNNSDSAAAIMSAWRKGRY